MYVDEDELNKLSDRVVNEIFGEILNEYLIYKVNINITPPLTDEEIINEYDFIDKQEILDDVSNLIVKDMPCAFNNKGIDLRKIKNLIMETQKDINYIDVIWRLGALTCSAYSWWNFANSLYRDPVAISKLLKLLSLLKMK
jgi:hypothetical protein